MAANVAVSYLQHPALARNANKDGGGTNRRASVFRLLYAFPKLVTAAKSGAGNAVRA